MTLAQKLYEASWEMEYGTLPAPPFGTLPSAAVAHWSSLASVAESTLTGSDASVSAARASALADLARELVAAVQAERADRKDFEFSTSEMQERKRRTTRLLAKMKAAIEEVGR